MTSITIPLRTGRGQNDREHWRARAKRVKAEKLAVGWSLVGKPCPPLPCVVRLTRVAPSSGCDSDNLVGALKAVRDAVADWLGVDDKHAEIVRYEYAQARGKWSVLIDCRAIGVV